ncbi:RNA polymerase sigma factor [Actinokineospora sp. NBRC 105648]|uniref:RNA polymerase sigma factor n=1 Tax=Actinokineospora sp. NBRC 105648 TaxID=3032206 RepID=UPI002553877B|nr:RNA polymerase sigma factor [Actinokineospora sp. NBRC 105648]
MTDPSTRGASELDASRTADPDTSLWRRAAAGEREAFGALFERHAEALWNHCYRLTGSWALAEDITSATFLTAWAKVGGITLVRESALPWLYAVAGNIVRTENRRTARFARAVRRLPEDGTAEDHAEAVAHRVDVDRRTREVATAVARLPRAEREAVELCLLGELSTVDAATLLGIAEASVRARLSRARGRLRTLLEVTP